MQPTGKAEEASPVGVIVEVLQNFVGGNPVAEVEGEVGVPDLATEELLEWVPLSGAEYMGRVLCVAAEASEERESVIRRVRRGGILHREEGGALASVGGAIPEKATVDVGLLT